MVLEVYTWVGLAALLLPLLTPRVAGECIRLEQDTFLLSECQKSLGSSNTEPFSKKTMLHFHFFLEN